MTFNVGDPVMINTGCILARVDVITDQFGITAKQAATLLPPQSYIGTVVDADRKSPGGSTMYGVKWDHLGEAGGPYDVFEHELRPGS